MHQSSNAIGAIASALAKAQAEITNPEKSLVASIRSPLVPEGERTFRYAPLSSGLDIVRKSLGKHEIATIQTTTIDKDSGLVRLITVLAHSSGEWISSEWPVCPISEVASPHRMGASLTYARRYALFALVGIAGEDDLDAPDLPTSILTGPAKSSPSRQTNGQDRQAGDGRKFSARSVKPVLDSTNSARVRDELITEIATLETGEELAGWAHRILPKKNSLIAADAHIIEEKFSARSDAISSSSAAVSEDPENQPPVDPLHKEEHRGEQGSNTHLHPIEQLDTQPHQLKLPNETKHPAVEQSQIDKSILPIATLKRLRNKAHLRFVASQACLVCGRQPSDPHHLRFAQQRGLGLKVSDEFTVPLCRIHHRQVHQTIKERAWWTKLNIDALSIAARLWQKSLARNGQSIESEAPAARSPGAAQ